MFQEELPAIISVTVIVIVFLTAFWQDMGRLRKHSARTNQPAAPRGRHFAMYKTASAKEQVRIDAEDRTRA